MPRLIWSRRALGDVARLHAFLRPKSPDAAKRAIGAIRKGVRILARHPEVGRPVERLPAEFREWPIEFGDGGYLALYRIEGDEVVILAVRHMLESGY